LQSASSPPPNDVTGLAGLLAEDVGVYADGGGTGSAIAEGRNGRDVAAKVLADLLRRFVTEKISMIPAEVNGQPGAITKDSEGRVLSAMSLDIVADHIQAVRAVTNPDKLGHLTAT
jgi:RNA polymerase sigma-70 factor (ECF subfamily)